MKSLEIVNELIECFEDKVEFQKDFLRANPKEKPNPIFERQLNGCKQIKQDLEVLDILLTKTVDLEDLFYLFNKYPDEEDEYILECYNDCHKRKLTMEELQKIK